MLTAGQNTINFTLRQIFKEIFKYILYNKKINIQGRDYLKHHSL